MAYYLQSLVRVIELILCHEKQHKYFDDNNTTPQLRSLMEKACFLRDSFANHAILSHQQDSFENRIQDVAENAEDVLETYVSLYATEDTIPAPDLQSLLESFDSLKEEMMEILDGDRASGHRPLPAVASSRINERNPNNIMVGFTEDLIELKGRVFGESSQLEIIPIVGMGGIGKTTLARSIHDDSSVASHFDVCAWTTVSNDYSLRDILLGLLRSIPGNQMIGEEAHTLGLTLHQGLMGRRYLIVLDDIWRSDAWYDVKKYFPNENNRSRIILTTRQSHVATCVDSKSLLHHVRPLGKDNSWELLRKKVFGEEACLPELEKLGRKIANSCGGLPLALQVIGGLLSQTERRKTSWKQVASDVISTITNEDEQISSILSLSYNNLPYYLKPCFLYMSAFPEDSDIRSSTLIRQWVAEGFLIPILGKSQEEVASAHINALIERNLIFVRYQRQRRFEEDTYLGIHDLLLELCVRKAREKKFFHVVDGTIDLNASRDMSGVRRVNFLSSLILVEDTYDSTKQRQLTRSLLTSNFFSRRDEIAGHGFYTLRLVNSIWTRDFEAVIEAVNLRYLRVVGEFDSRITTFRNLQFLIIEGYGRRIKVPHELFEMPQLREISTPSESILVCDFKERLLSKNLVFQENLHTLRILKISANIELVLAKFPNLKNLGLEYSGRLNSHPTYSPLIIIVSCLRKIERLDMSGFSNYLLDCSFSDTLKSLSLSNFTLPEASMEALGMLPNLEYLFLNDIQLQDTRIWKLSESEGKFRRLKHLSLSYLNWVRWEADETDFPILEELVIIYCKSLEELPSAIGDIDTLKKLTVRNSSRSVEVWATQIKEEQLDYGNQLLQVDAYTRPFDLNRVSDSDSSDTDSDCSSVQQLKKKKTDEFLSLH